MQATTQIIHAYKQAPWRIQRQYIGAFLLIVVGSAMIASIYLDVTAQAALTGREIQRLQLDISTNQRLNADLETQLAESTSSANMQQRALELGYRPVKPGELDYVSVPGYSKSEPAILMAAPDVQTQSHSLPAEYTQSLLEWFDEKVIQGNAR